MRYDISSESVSRHIVPRVHDGKIRIPAADSILAQVLMSTDEVTFPIENSARELTWPRKLGSLAPGFH
jgi:hypothetical protein